MADLNIRIHIRLSRETFRWTLLAALLSVCAGEIASESFTMTSYYPAPSGIYTQMITTGKTFLARDGGNVGIGTTSPLGKLDVLAGAARTPTPATSPSFYVTGTMQAGTLGPGTGNVEFRHDNGSQGIGFGYNTIYQTGTNADQSLNLQSRGTGALTLNAYAYGTGNVGIGTTAPLAILDVRRANDSGLILRLGTVASVGTFDFSRSASNGNLIIQGNQTGAAVPGSPNASIALAPGIGYVGIGTMSPMAKLHVAGSLRIVDGTQAAGKVLTSAADGTASWVTPSKGTLSCTTVFYQAVDSPNASAYCPAGSVRVSGGCTAGGTWWVGTQPLTASSPDETNGGGWDCHQSNNLGSRDAKAFAVCCTIL